MDSGALLDLTDDTFDDRLQRTGLPVLVDFWADWCQPCKVIEPHLRELAGEFDGRLLIARVNVDESDLLAYRYAIRSIPTLLVVRDGRVLNQMVGAAPKDTIREFVFPYLESGS